MLSQRRFGVFDIGFGDGELGGGALLAGDCRVERDLRACAFGDEFLGAVQVELGLVQIRFRPLDGGLLQIDIRLGDGEAGFLLAHPGFEGRRLDAGEHLALLHFAGEVDVELADIARELRADVHSAERAHRARGRHRPAHIGTRSGDGLNIELSFGLLEPIVIAGPGRETGGEENCQPAHSHPKIFVIPRRHILSRRFAPKSLQNGNDLNAVVPGAPPAGTTGARGPWPSAPDRRTAGSSSRRRI